MKGAPSDEKYSIQKSCIHISCSDYTSDPETDEYGVKMVLQRQTEFQDVVDFSSSLINEGVTECEFYLINDIPAIMYKKPDIDGIILAVVSETKDVLELCFWPYSDEDYLSLSMLMIASLQIDE